MLNTDAEGRLVLADALALAARPAPDAIVDLATLTGAVAGRAGQPGGGGPGQPTTRWCDQVSEAGEAAGERHVAAPAADDYRTLLDSDVADLRNISKSRGGGTITAALFLQEFVGDGIPWAHLDIAGTAWWAEGEQAEFANGGTGYGVRLLLELARTFTRPKRTTAR